MVQHDQALERTAPLMPGDVRDYLLEHPDFFDDNGDLLDCLVPPELRNGAGIQDFQHYMLARLQEHLSSIRDEHDNLMDLMQDHIVRQGRLNAAVLALLDAKGFENIVRVVTTDLVLLLEHEWVGLFIESGGILEAGNCGGVQIVPEGFVQTWLKGRAITLAEETEPAFEVFGETAPRVRSHAFVRLDLGDGMPEAMLALGHADPLYYATGLATEQIECLAAVIERCVSAELV